MGPVTGFDCAFSDATIASTAFSMPRVIAIGFHPFFADPIEEAIFKKQEEETGEDNAHPFEL
jgi:hypothetical protein